MLELLNGFVGELRNAGIPVSLTENLDAFEAVKHIPIEDREAFKFALAATMVKNPTPRPWLVRSATTFAGYRITRSPVITHSPM